MKKYFIHLASLMLATGILGQVHAEQNDSQTPNSIEALKAIEARPNFHMHHFSTSGPSGYSPAQIRKAYGISSTLGTGAGQTIAIIDAYGSPTAQHDLNTFNQHFGLPYIGLQIYYPQGAPTIDSGWALETSLDIEWAHAVAPSAKLMLVVARTASLLDLLAAVDYAVARGATQISMSWGASEFSSQTSYDFHFNHPKVSFFASSGDGGAGVSWPAASPNVTAVGGTSLYLDATGNLTHPEVAWAGSGGGESYYEAEPSFQSHFQSSGRRGIPDVSYNADPATGFPVYDSTTYSGQSGWFQVGGTSAGAPQWAALIAIANAKRTTQLQQSPNTALYTLGAPTYPTVNFRDIVTGCNGPASAITCAKKGYDFVTGLGSPLAPSLVKGYDSLK